MDENKTIQETRETVSKKATKSSSPDKNKKRGQKATDSSKKKAKTSVLSDVLLLLLKILIIILIFVLLFTFLFGATRLNDISMEPNVKSGDLVVYYRLDKNYVATNCVAYKYQGKTYVMRVVATAGDTVDMTADGMTINGALQSEPDPSQETLPYEGGVEFPVKLKTGQVFLMGDNRENSVDSRVFGAVQSRDTLGEVMTIIRRRNF